jgi:uroporphyrinogen III methyltransferase/synthase
MTLDDESGGTLGMVHLVGTGPGDPRLITLRGRELIDRADAIVFDRSVSRSLLPAHARESGHPELYDTGKRRGGNASRSTINDLLVQLARDGKRVVRLYGGDPFVFGRGGEEAQALNDASVPFEVVPGVTAGVGAAAQAGIPVTHRGLAHAVTFVSGGEIPGKAATQSDWSAIAKVGGTVVIYMATASLDKTIAALREGGMPDDMPVAIVQRGTRHDQRTLTATLGTVVERARSAGIAAPSIAVIGWTVILRDELTWFEQRPFFGRRFIIGRDGASKHLGEMLRDLGARVTAMPEYNAPRIDPSALKREIASLTEYSWIVFSTAASVAIFWEQLLGSGRDARALAGLSVAAVAAEAAGALLERGIAVDLIPERFAEDSLLEKLGEREVSGSRILLVAPEVRSSSLYRGIESLGAETTLLHVYRPIPDARAVDRIARILESNRADAVVFITPAEVRAFVDVVPAHLHGGVRALSPSDRVTQALTEAGIALLAQAEGPGPESMVAALERALK